MPSRDFERFYESCFGDSFGIIHDGVDQQAILNLKDDEREEADMPHFLCPIEMRVWSGLIKY